MHPTRARVLAIMDNVVPESSSPAHLHEDSSLRALGFASMDLVTLFVELEAEFSLGVEHLDGYLQKNCTLRGLVAMCMAA